MGSCSILGGIQTLDAQHLQNITDSDLTRTVTRTSSGKRIAAVAAYTDTTRHGIQRHSGQTRRALLKRGGPRLRPVSTLQNYTKEKGSCIHFSLTFVSLLTISSENQNFSGKSQAAPLAEAARA
jgi:hypothetical protein